MLANMRDPKSIVSAMTAALFTKLYGSFIANMIAFTIMQKLEQRSEADDINNKLIIKSLPFISAGGNPRATQEMLFRDLPSQVRTNLKSAA